MAGLKTCWQNAFRPPVWLPVIGLAVLLLGLPPAPARAQDRPSSVVDVVSLTLVPLSNSSIANVKGSFLQAPSIGNAAPSGGTITLWDELKPPAQSQNVLNGTSTITINSITK